MGAYVHAVKDGTFPNPEREGYAIDPVEWESFLHTQGQKSLVVESPEKQRPLGSGSNTTSDIQPHECRTSAAVRANETDERTGKQGELHTFRHL